MSNKNLALKTGKVAGKAAKKLVQKQLQKKIRNKIIAGSLSAVIVVAGGVLVLIVLIASMQMQNIQGAAAEMIADKATEIGENVESLKSIFEAEAASAKTPGFATLLMCIAQSGSTGIGDDIMLASEFSENTSYSHEAFGITDNGYSIAVGAKHFAATMQAEAGEIPNVTEKGRFDFNPARTASESIGAMKSAIDRYFENTSFAEYFPDFSAEVWELYKSIFPECEEYPKPITPLNTDLLIPLAETALTEDVEKIKSDSAAKGEEFVFEPMPPAENPKFTHFVDWKLVTAGFVGRYGKNVAGEHTEDELKELYIAFAREVVTFTVVWTTSESPGFVGPMPPGLTPMITTATCTAAQRMFDEMVLIYSFTEEQTAAARETYEIKE